MNQRYELHSENKAYFRLREYLGFKGKYPYEDLRPDMQAAYDAGLHVYLWSVTGEIIVTGHPDLSGWHVMYGDYWVKTLREVTI